jgi:glycyl-tRNA synthetase (class II)
MNQEDKNTIKELESIHKQIQVSLVNLWVKIQELKKVCHRPDDNSHYCKDRLDCRYGTQIGEDDYDETCSCCMGYCGMAEYCNCYELIP